MIHQFKSNGYNIVMDVNSGSIHVVDEIVYDMIQVVEPLIKEGIKDADTLRMAVLNLDILPYDRAELEEALSQEDESGILEEVGDVMFSAANVSRLVKSDPEEALTYSTDKFVRRFASMEQAAMKHGIELTGCTIEELNDLWQEAKKEEKSIGGILK